MIDHIMTNKRDEVSFPLHISPNLLNEAISGAPD